LAVCEVLAIARVNTQKRDKINEEKPTFFWDELSLENRHDLVAFWDFHYPINRDVIFDFCRFFCKRFSTWQLKGRQKQM
jgi:hypothetical protein